MEDIDSSIDPRSPKLQNFEVFKGSHFRHSPPSIDKSVTHCSDMLKKDRRPSCLTESLNVALGLNDYRQVIVSGLVSPAALFATFTAHHDKLTELHY